MSELVENIRTGLRELLALISDPESQREYERNVPVANVATELICMWFDDLYHPDPQWISGGFSPRELELLAEFHDFYDHRADSLPTDGGVAILQRSPEWSEVMRKAQETRVKLGWAT